jgi:hypothetical protein
MRRQTPNFAEFNVHRDPLLRRTTWSPWRLTRCFGTRQPQLVFNILWSRPYHPQPTSPSSGPPLSTTCYCSFYYIHFPTIDIYQRTTDLPSSWALWPKASLFLSYILSTLLQCEMCIPKTDIWRAILTCCAFMLDTMPGPTPLLLRTLRRPQSYAPRIGAKSREDCVDKGWTIPEALCTQRRLFTLA